MRISTNTIYQTAISKISTLQIEQSKLQQQIASGKRIISPSDDPIAASRALEISHAQSVNTQYEDNRKIANTHLTGLDISLGSITELLTTSRTTLVANAGTLTANQKEALSINLKASLTTLLGYANTKDAMGNYMYAGLHNETKPFTATPSGATYNGDSNLQLLQVDGQRKMAVNAPGNNVFQAGGNDVFSAYSDLAIILDNPASTDTDVTNAVAAALSSMDAAIKTVANARSAVGTKLNEIDALNDSGMSRNLQYAQALSDLQDLDYAQALSDLSQKKIILEAAQKSFVQTTGLSLFDYIR
ncbi:MAG: flagellar hook-associated protein FlgL [Methylophilaceae bacterium]